MISVWVKSVSTNEQNAAEHPYKTIISNHGDFFLLYLLVWDIKEMMQQM